MPFFGVGVKLLNVIFPKKCFGCAKENTFLCATCVKKLPKFLMGNNILSATSYESKIIKKAIWTLKYKKAKQIAKPLALLIADRLHSYFLNYRGSTSIVVIPIPLHKKQLRKRGFNQAELIAKHLSDMLNTPLNTTCLMLTNVLYKHGSTVSQVKIKDRTKRLKNLKGVFSIKNPELIKNKIIYLVDDVSTTGTTINECRKILLKSGARKVTGVVVAKG